MAERKEWFSVAHTANGKTSVTCSIQEDNLSVKWSVKCFTSSIKSGVAEARKYADKAMKDLQEAVAAAADETDEEAAA